ncbi:MAG: hypothetical protein ACHQU1_04110 [Gemmatimonadales bacterium]
MRSTDADPATPSGFILPTTLLVMTLLTVMLTAAFIMASAEFRASDNSLASSRALSLAQAGLENYFSQQRSLDTSSTYDSVRISFSNGYADVVGRRIRAQTTNRLPRWLVRSIGTATDPRQPGQVQGQRAVAQVAELNNNVIPSRAAIVALNGIVMTGTSTNPINGTNANIGSSWVVGCITPPGADTAAATVGNPPSYVNGGVGASFPQPTRQVQSSWSASVVYDSTHIDWQRVLALDFSPDYVGSLPPECSGNSTVCPYESHYYAGDVTVPPTVVTGRRGLLIASGNVTITGSHWDGIIIAGGRLIATGTFILHGMAITGLRCGTSTCPAVDSIPRGTGQLYWDWCYTHAAIGGLNGLVPFKNTWVDTWSLY